MTTYGSAIYRDHVPERSAPCVTKLEEAGYVAVTKEFVKRKPRTTARITPEGRSAFLAHVDHRALEARQVNG